MEGTFSHAGRSSNGKTADSGSAYRGSNPCLPANLSAVRRSHKLKHWRFFELAMLGLAAWRIAWQLFASPSLGIADNNDFPKLIGRYCLGPAGPPSIRICEPYERA